MRFEFGFYLIKQTKDIVYEKSSFNLKFYKKSAGQLPNLLFLENSSEHP